MKAQLLKPDLIVLEVAIPRLNGVEAAPKLRKLLPKTPIILFALHGSLLKGCDTRELGVDPVVCQTGWHFRARRLGSYSVCKKPGNWHDQVSCSQLHIFQGGVVTPFPSTNLFKPSPTQ
jgi:CheY-like chemotaxis protein